MIISVYLPLLLPLLAMPAVRWAGNRVAPAALSWLIVVSGVVLAGCSTLALSMLMFAALSTLGPFARLGHWSPAALGQLDAVHLPLDVAAGVLLIALVGNGIRVAIRRVGALGEAHRAAQAMSDSELSVLRDSRPLAYALPGRPGRIVVSTSMLTELAAVERRALLAHERAHLTNAHHLFVAVVDVLAAVNPLLRPLRSVIRYTTERWADESAAAVVGDRRVVARAVGKAALAARSASPDSTVAMAATAGPVPRRIGALLVAAPRRSPLVSVSGVCAAVACGLMIISLVASADALTDLHHIVEVAQHQALGPVMHRRV